MRKMGLLMGVAAVALLATACEMRFYMGLTVEEDGSGTMSFDLAADSELRNLAGGELDIGELLNADPGMPCDVAPLSDGDFQGARMTCSFASLEELMEMSIPMDEDFEQAMPQPASDFLVERDGDTFRFLMDAAGLNEAYNLPPDEGMPMELDLDSILDIRFTATLPGEIVSHNASVAEGNTLTWWFPTAESRLMAESRVSSGLNPVVLWSLIAVAAIILVMMVLRFRLTGKKEPDPSEPEPAPKAETGPTYEAPSASEPESETASGAEPETGETSGQTSESEDAPATEQPESGSGTEQPEQEAEENTEADEREEPERPD